MPVASQYFIHGEIDSRLNSEIACYHAVYKLFSFRLLYKKPRDQDTQRYNSTCVCMRVKLGLFISKKGQFENVRARGAKKNSWPKEG